MAQLQGLGISKAFDGHAILDDVSVSVDPSEFLVIVGRSGTGKSTLLRVLAGLEQQDTGIVSLDGEILPPPQGKLVRGHEDIQIAHQGFELHPHMSAKENIERGLLAYQPDYRAHRTTRLLALADLQHATKSKPRELSGGQQQKLAIATALATEPKVLLLDEPFSNLDPFSRDAFLQEIKQNAAEMETSVILVTHDTREALSVADRLLVLEGGRISQEGSPEDIYQSPRTPSVADFFGRVNYFSRAQAQELWPELVVDERVRSIGFRPEALRIVDDGPLKGEVAAVSYQGGNYMVTVACQEREQLFVIGSDRMATGSEVSCDILARQCMYFRS
ncbi:MAG: ABC transporter ATP-binding protein [Bacteroidota bacterium]